MLYEAACMRQRNGTLFGRSLDRKNARKAVERHAVAGRAHAIAAGNFILSWRQSIDRSASKALCSRSQCSNGVTGDRRDAPSDREVRPGSPPEAGGAPPD